MHKFTVNILADNTRTAAEMCKTASEALSSGTMRLCEERAKGSVAYIWEPGLAAILYAMGTGNSHRLSEACPSLFSLLSQEGAVVAVSKDKAPTGVIFLEVGIGPVVHKFAVSANEAVLVRTIP